MVAELPDISLMRQLQSLFRSKVLPDDIFEVFLGVYSFLYLALLSAHLYIMDSKKDPMQRKTFTIRTTKTQHKHLTQSTLRPKTHFQLAKTPQEASKIAAKVNQAWIMVRNAGMEISRQTVLKYLGKKMKEKVFKYRDILMETLQTGELPRPDKKMEDFSETLLVFEVDQMLEQLEVFLEKRIQRDIEVLREQIEQADGNVQQAIDAEYYQKLVCSFRPTLITNSSDLAMEYQSLSGQCGHKTSRSCRIQQNRYLQLGRLERTVADMHNQVYLEKSDSKFIDFIHAIKDIL